MLGPQFRYTDNPAMERANHLYGRQRLTDLFGGAPITPTPWPSVAKTKAGLPVDRERVAEVLSQPPRLAEFDPRRLHAIQPSVLREHVEYYRGGEYDRTGRTSADHDDVGNRYPVVYRDGRGRNIILSGHHRAADALLRGEPLRAREVTED